MGGPTHRLEAELNHRIQTDPEVFRFLQEGTLDGLWYWDLEKPEEEWMNDRLWEVLGYEPDAMPHTPAAWQDLIHPDDGKRAEANFHAHLADPSHPYDQVVRYTHADGSTVWVRCRGLIIRDRDGAPKRMLGAHTELTELMETKAALETANLELSHANANLKVANQELLDFAWAASHDLKAPLRGVEQLAHWIEEDIADGNLDDVGDNLDLLKGRVSRLQRLLADLLLFSRVDRDVSTAHTTPVRLSEVVADVRDLGSIPKSIAVHVEGDDPVLTTPGVLLQRVLLNLTNAVKHHDQPEGTITVRSERAGNLLDIRVIDDGPGIPPKFRERVFKLFERLKSRDQVEGSGLGLSIVRRTVERVGGSIRIEPSTERGTTVHLTWPITTEDADAQ